MSFVEHYYIENKLNFLAQELYYPDLYKNIRQSKIGYFLVQKRKLFKIKKIELIQILATIKERFEFGY